MAGMEFIRDLAVVMVIAGAVGWICQRVGLSLVVGYLVAGAIIGPFTPPVQLVADLDRVQMLSQLGLVFLIFSIGLDLSFQRLRRLGVSIAVATVVGALLVFYGCRVAGLALGWSNTQSLFVAGMLMVSSSAIISKVLQELNATHKRPGQLALGVTVLEDVVAVVMLTILSTVVQFGGEKSPQITQTLGTLSAFIAALLLISLLFVPRLLLRLTRSGNSEVRTLVVIGLVLSLAWLAARAGYSLALGAFLLGVIVASTPQKPEIKRVVEGIRDMFGAVFFVAMGMLVDFGLLIQAWPLVLGMTVFALVFRPLASAFGLVLGGNSMRDSVRAGLALAPLGEFSFITAQMGVAAGLIPDTFFPMAVGASLLTTLAGPTLIRRSDAISAAVERRLPLFAREWIAFYDSWLKRLGQHQQRSVVWRLTGWRLAQTAVQILSVSALILFVAPVYRRIERVVGDDWLFPNGLPILFWSIYGLVLLAPLVAIWRNTEALAMIYAESATRGTARHRALRPVLQTALKTVTMAMLVIWLLVLLPFGQSLVWVSVAVAGILGLLAAVFWRRLVRWHSRMEIELQTQLKSALGSDAGSNLSQALRERQEDWELQAAEFVVPDFAECAGRKIGELALRTRFGCSIASIDRQGFSISNPSSGTGIYPRDQLLLIGSTAQIEEATRVLGAPKASGPAYEIEELSLEVVKVPQGSACGGQTLLELDLIRKIGVQVAGIERNGRRTLTPSGGDRIEPGDDVLALGTQRQLQDFRELLNSGAAAAPPA